MCTPARIGAARAARPHLGLKSKGWLRGQGPMLHEDGRAGKAVEPNAWARSMAPPPRKRAGYRGPCLLTHKPYLISVGFVCGGGGGVALFACGATTRTTRGVVGRAGSTGETGRGRGCGDAWVGTVAATAGRAAGAACRAAAAAGWAGGFAGAEGSAACGPFAVSAGAGLTVGACGLATTASLAALRRLISSWATARTVMPDSPGYLAT